MWPFTKKQSPVITKAEQLSWYSLVQDDTFDDNIRSRLLKKQPSWTNTKISELIKEYKNFLFLAANSNTEQTPSADVDEVWHEHILFTKDYERWCKMLGKTIHHNPEKIGEKKDYSKQFEETKSSLKKMKKKEISKRKVSSPSRSSSISNGSPIENDFGNAITNTMLMHSVFGSSSCDESHSSHSSHDSGSSSCHDSSPSSCSSSSCSSSSCSSSSCGGGGGD